MAKWEYQVETCERDELAEKLTELGEYGWEAVSVVVAVYSAIEAPGHSTGLQAEAYSFTAKRLLEE
jgi:hypothetical protein